MDPPFETLESQIEGMWRELLGDELSLYDMPEVCAQTPYVSAWTHC